MIGTDRSEPTQDGALVESLEAVHVVSNLDRSVDVSMFDDVADLLATKLKTITFHNCVSRA